MCIRRLSPPLTAIAWLAATATLSVWFGASTAYATCGDYLMMQDHDGSVGTREVMRDLTRDARPHIPVTPCHGSGCRQAPEGAMTVLITLDRNRDTQLPPDFSTGDVATPRTSQCRWPISDADAARGYRGGLFRPPRQRLL